MGSTVEKKDSVKNGIKRLIIAILAILLEILGIFYLFAKVYINYLWFEVVTRIVAAVLVLLIYGQRKTSSMKMPWIMLILISPILGVFLYLSVGLNFYTIVMRKRCNRLDQELLKLLPDNEEELKTLKETDPAAGSVASYIQHCAGYPLYDDSDSGLVYFAEAADGLEAQLRELKKAEHYIFMEYHAIEEKEAWHRVQEVLEDRVRHGVEVRLFYDDLGSIGFITTDFVKRMKRLGIQCKVFNPFVPGFRVFMNNRDHRKITVIDGRVGFTGGYNLADEYFNIAHPYGMWKDTGVMITGSAVRSLTVTFLSMWNAVKRQVHRDKDWEPYLPMRDLIRDGKDGFAAGTLMGGDPWGSGVQVAGALQEDACDLVLEPDAMAGPQEQETAGRSYVQPYADSPMDDEQVGENVYISIIEKAERYCYFMTPYLIITDEMAHAITLAAKRGVDVRIVTPGIPDKKLIYRVTRSFYNCLVCKGVRIYEWTPGFNHAKTCLADDKIATCGTINLDYRSLYHHFENGCFFYGGAAIADVREDFEKTFAASREVTEQYRLKPGPAKGAVDLILRLFAELL